MTDEMQRLLQWIDGSIDVERAWRDLLEYLEVVPGETAITIPDQEGHPARSIPLDCEVHMVTKVLRQQAVKMWMSPFSVILGLGDIETAADGTPVPQYGFATVEYDENMEWITADLHEEWR